MSDYETIRKERDIYLIPKEHKYTLIFMHGFGDSPNGWYDNFLYQNPFPNTTKIVLICAPYVMTTFCHSQMTSWYDLFKFDFTSESNANYEDIPKNSEKIFKIIDDEAKLLNNDYTKIFVGGFSQGCSMALHIGLNCEHLLGGIVGFSGFLFTKSLKEDNLKKGLKIFTGHGEADNVINLSLAQMSYKPFENYNHKMFTYKNMKHSICDKELEDVTEYFNLE